MGAFVGSCIVSVRTSAVQMVLEQGEMKNTLSKRSHTSRPCPPSHDFPTDGSRGDLTRSHPRIRNSDLTLEIGKVGGAGNTRLSHPPAGSICHPIFLLPLFSPCRNSPSLMPAVWPHWPLLGRLFHFFKPSFSFPHFTR